MFFYFLVLCSWSRAALFMPSLYANKFVRFERTIWPSIEFKKSLDIFWSRLERRRSEEYLDHFDLQVDALRVTSRLEFILKNSSWNTATICEVLFMTQDFQRHFTQAAYLRVKTLGTLSTRTGEEDDALLEVKSRISIAVRLRIGCIIPSCPRLRREVRSFDVVHRT